MPASTGTVVLVTREGMGHGGPALQRELSAKYLELLVANANPPGALCFCTEGVRLVTEGSPVREDLRAIESAGIHLPVCQTGLNHDGLVERVQVGIVGGMGNILAAPTTAAIVITL
jgi:hypothetical protein